jgi:hypothetical protein
MYSSPISEETEAFSPRGGDLYHSEWFTFNVSILQTTNVNQEPKSAKLSAKHYWWGCFFKNSIGFKSLKPVSQILTLYFSLKSDPILTYNNNEQYLLLVL